MELIAAVARDWCIGREGRLLYAVPEDLKRFRELTLGKAIAYGRRTMATFPEGKPLPGRKNYVLTHFPQTLPPPAQAVASPEALCRIAEREEVFLVGGAMVYVEMLDCCTRAHLTCIDAPGGGDAFFPNLDARPDWHLVQASEPQEWNGLRYRFCVYEHDAVCPL